MTTPQDMPAEVPETADEAAPPEPRDGVLYTFATRLVAWTVFMACMAILIGLVVFVALGLYQGILWLWPGGSIG